MTLNESHLALARKLVGAARGRWGIPYEDAVSNAYLGLVEAARAYDPDRGPFEPFAVRYVKGRILNGIRGEVRAQERVKQAKLARPAVAPAPHANVEAAELWAEVGTLPVEQRLMVLLRYRWGLTQTEIATTLETSQSRVWRMLTSAHDQLAKVA